MTLSRTLPPLLPANFLSRRNLVDSVDISAPGTTLIVGPIGYGKTSFATEIALRYPDRTFWYTMVDEDTAQIFNAHVIQAVRNVIPQFAPWFKASQKYEPMDLILRFSNELANNKGEFIFIVDNRRTSKAINFAVANQMIQSLPRNLHLIQIRRDLPEATVTELAPAGRFQKFGPAELCFTTEEVAQIAHLHNLSSDTSDVIETLQSAQGWPAAVQLIARGLSKGQKFDTSANEISKSIQPLRLIVEETVRGLTPKEKSLLVPLSAIPEFSSDLALRILGKRFSQHELDSLAFEGSILVKTRSEESIYKIHSLIKEALYKELSKSDAELMRVHQIISVYFEENLNPTGALEHAFLSKDFERFENLFREGARIYVVTGRGHELIRWSKFAGDDSIEGQLKRQTVEIAGHLANLNLEQVQALNSSMRLQAKGTSLEAFIERYSSLIEIGIDSAFARFDSLEKNVAIATRSDALALDINFTDTLYALRRLAGYYFLTDQSEKLEAIDIQASQYLQQSYSQLGQVHQLAIRAFCTYQQGYYQDAFETSRMAISISNKLGLTSFQSSNDVRYILARCTHQFTDIENAISIFNEVIGDSEKCQQWIWYCSSITFVAAHYAQWGDIAAGLEMIRRAHARISIIHSKNNLASILDRGEMVIRLAEGDIERIRLLINTSLPGEAVESIKLFIMRLDGKDWESFSSQALPERTPRQKIYKLFSQTVQALERDEGEAINYLTAALKIGAEVGAKGVFLRQIDFYPLLHKIATKTPTFYHEDISRKAAIKMHELQSRVSAKPELTKREIEIVRQLDSGKPITSIGATLHISHNTMKTHLKNIYRKLAVEGRHQAVEKTKSLGLI